MEHPAARPAPLTLREVIAILGQIAPLTTAQSWDQVGLVSGDPDNPVSRVLVAVDPTLAVIAEADRVGAQLLVTHHPLLLRGIHSVAVTSAKGAAVVALIRSDIAHYVAHTNADVADPGVSSALAAACGLQQVRPLSMSEDQPLGRVGNLPAAMTLRAFAEHLATILPGTSAGIRVAGPDQALVQRVAVLGGAGDSLFAAAHQVAADVYVTADLRHHPALEERETARNGRPYLIDAGHYATEAVWLPVLAQQLRAAAPDRLEVIESEVCTDPWDFVVGANAASRAGSRQVTPNKENCP